jgi:hypothetical protein
LPIRFLRTLSPVTRLLLLWALVNPVLVTCALLLGRPRGTLLPYLAQFLVFGPENFDSWGPMARALDYLRLGHDQSVYEQIFFTEQVKFQYPLTSLLFLYPVEAMHRLLAQAGLSLMTVLDAISWLALVSTVAVSIRIFNSRLMDCLGPAAVPRSRLDAGVRSTVLAALGFTFYPILKGYSLGQIQTWVTMLFACLVWAWTSRQVAAAGVLSGLMCLIKPQYALLLVWGVFRRQWRFAAACAATAGAGGIAALALFGWADNIDYRRVLTFIAQHGESYYANHSVNGLLNRYLGNGFNLRFDMHGFAPFDPRVYFWTTFATVGFSLVAVLPLPGRNARRPDAFDLAFVVVSATLASPIAWEHHYGVLLPVYALLLPRVLASRSGAALTLLAASHLLTSNYLGITRRFAGAGPAWTLLQSYVFAGGLIVWGMLLALRLGLVARGDRAGEPAPEPARRF